MNALEQIRHLENEIFGAADMEAKLRRFVKRGCTDEQGRIAERQLEEIDKLIAMAQAEIKLIETYEFAEVQMKRRDEKYPAITPRPPIRIFEFERVYEVSDSFSGQGYSIGVV